eukprot:10343134-Ditylum_brightwellii.AAC.1
MERICTETYWQIFDAHGVALEGRIGRQKKKGVGPGQGGKCVKKSGTERRWLHPAGYLPHLSAPTNSTRPM